ncbi:MAG: amidohydrolase family protein [Bacteroidia bacterium]|nr:amidohydrolase family protein [Bacteroidia bacterium]
MKLDAHHHLWTYSAQAYDWIGDDMAVLRRDFGPADLVTCLRENGYDAAIAVQARQTEEETRWLLALAAECPEIAGVVGWLDLCSPELETALARWSADPKLAGLRHVVQAEPDDRFMLRPDFMRGISQLSAYGLVYDLLVFPRQLPAAIELVSAFPEQVFVLDHIAKPPIGTRGFQPWADLIRDLATAPQVSCKLSGLVTEADWTGWKPDDLYPYLDHVCEVFGPDRLMIGSDWPVCLLAGTYTQVMDTTAHYLQSRFSGPVLDQVLGDNAARIYLKRKQRVS